MITGASRAEAALLVIDAHEGVRENSRRHGFMLSMLGIRQIAVLVNKMDLVDYSRPVFERHRRRIRGVSRPLGVTPRCYIPVSGATGENMATLRRRTSRGTAVRRCSRRSTQFDNRVPLTSAAFRMPVQGVYKFTEHNDSRRIVAGTVESGRLAAGDEVVFYPSGKKSGSDASKRSTAHRRAEALAGEAAGFTLDDQIYVMRGEIAARTGQPEPHRHDASAR